MTLDEKWKADLEIRLDQDKRDLELRIAATELAIGAISSELQRNSHETTGRMGSAISNRIKTTGGVLAPMIDAQARKILNL